MLRTILFLFLCASPTTFLFSQTSYSNRFQYLSDYDKRPLHYGFYVGMPLYSYKVVPNEKGVTPESERYIIESNSQGGISSGLILEYSLNQNIQLRFLPGITYVARELVFNNNNDPARRLRSITSAFVDVPIGFKFSSDRIGNFRPYLTTDFRYSFDLESNESKEEDNQDGVFRTTTNNYMYSFGVGIDIFFQYFKFSIGSHHIFGLNNEAIPDKRGTPENWAGVLDYVTTAATTFYVSFEI